MDFFKKLVIVCVLLVTTSLYAEIDNSLKLVALSYSYGNGGLPFGYSANINEIVSTTDVYADVKPKIIGSVFAYPNPFEMSEGTHIGYELSKPLELEIHFYNMFGQFLSKKQIDENSEEGGSVGYNRVPISSADFNNQDLPVGVYFVYITHQGTVLGKTKMAVIP
jgi:hypothetical protein